MKMCLVHGAYVFQAPTGESQENGAAPVSPAGIESTLKAINITVVPL